MSPSATSNVKASSVPSTMNAGRTSLVEANEAITSAAIPPTTRRAEIATTRPHGESMRPRAYIRSRPLRQRPGLVLLSEAETGAAVRAAALFAPELTAARAEHQHGVRAGPQRVGDGVPVVERQRGPQLLADLGDQDVARGSVAGVEGGQLLERSRVRVAGLADPQRGVGHGELLASCELVEHE